MNQKQFRRQLHRTEDLLAGVIPSAARDLGVFSWKVRRRCGQEPGSLAALGMTMQNSLGFRLLRLSFTHAFTDLKFHLACFLIGIHNDVVTVQNFAIQNLQRQ